VSRNLASFPMSNSDHVFTLGIEEEFQIVALAHPANKRVGSDICFKLRAVGANMGSSFSFSRLRLTQIKFPL
jgi:hypothetical protein